MSSRPTSWWPQPRPGIALTLAVAVLVATAGAATAATPTTKRVSVHSNEAQANGDSRTPDISANGRLVVFRSIAGDLVPGDANGQQDVFIRDRQTGTTKRISVGPIGDQGQANGGGFDPAISGNGRFVAFTSVAADVASDTNGAPDVYVHDRNTGKSRRVSVRSNGSQGNSSSFDPAVSADGRFVAFTSIAANLVAGDTNGESDVFIHDRRTGSTRRVSVRSNGSQANGSSLSPAVSADGRFVAFESAAANLVAADTNGESDVFIHDRRTGTTKRVSVHSNGRQGKRSSAVPAISANGRFVAFQSNAGNLVPGDNNDSADVFVHDRNTGNTRRVSVHSNGNQADQHGSIEPSISAEGRFVAFGSDAPDLVSGDTNGVADVFVHDRTTGKTRRVSVSSNGNQANGTTTARPAMSADGRFVAFGSIASDLVAGDTNNVVDIFVRGPLR